MGKPEDDDDDLTAAIRELAAKDPEAVMQLARERMKQILGTSLDLHDGSRYFQVKWTEGGVSVWASAQHIIAALKDANARGCDGLYVICLFDERPGDLN